MKIAVMTKRGESGENRLAFLIEGIEERPTNVVIPVIDKPKVLLFIEHILILKAAFL